MSNATDFKVIGTRPIRHDGLDKVTGRALYGADVQMAGLLHGRILRSPHAHARIRHLDASRALAVPGVEAVVTSQDLPDPGSRIAELGGENHTGIIDVPGTGRMSVVTDPTGAFFSILEPEAM